MLHLIDSVTRLNQDTDLSASGEIRVGIIYSVDSSLQ